MNFLFECAPINPATGVPATYRFSSLQGQSGSTLVDGKEWDAAIVATPETSVTYFQAGFVQQSSIDYGSISVRLTAATANLTNMLWDGATGRVWVGVEGQPFSAYTKIFEGALGAHSKEGDELKVPLYGLDFKLNETDILKSSYGGTGGVEGPASIKGTFKPRAYGSCRYVTPVRIDTANVVYQVHDGACQNIPAVYENAMSLGSPAFMVSTYAQLIALTLAPGTWARAPAVGMFRLANEPSGMFTADVVGDTAAGLTLASIATAILNGAGIASSDIDASVASVAGSIAWNTYITDQATVGDTLRKPFADAFLYLTTNEFGKFQAGSWLANGATINVGGPNASFNIISQSLTLEEAAPSNYSVTINAEKCWTVHDTQDISPAIADLQEGQALLNDAAKAAQTTADQAVADNAVEKARTDAILNDGILDISEKSERKLAYAGVVSDYPRIIAQANVYNVSSTAYTNAYTTLNTYLNNLTPPWNDLTQDTPITREAFNAAWEGERAARVAILRAIADATAKLANWSTVTGDGKPADNATVGAPAGTAINGVAVETITTNINAAIAAVATLNSGGYLDTTPPAIPTSLSLTSAMSDTGATLTAVWSASSDADFARYIVAVKEASGTFIEYPTTTPSYQIPGLARNRQYTVKIAAQDKNNNRSSFSAEVSTTTVRDTIAPSAPTGVAVESSQTSVFLTWANPVASDLAGVAIYRSATNDSSTAIQFDTVNAVSGTAGTHYSNLQATATYYFWLKAFDTSGNYSPFSAGVSITRKFVDLNDLTPGLTAPRIVSTLPAASGYTGTPLVFLQSDGKLYRYLNGAWTSAVAGADISAIPSTATVTNVVGANTLADAFNRAAFATVSGVPANIQGLVGTEALKNADITITNGTLTGIGTGTGTAISNALINVTSGVLNGIGTGTGTAVGNSLITVSNGLLGGIGTGNNTPVSNTLITLTNGVIGGIGTGTGAAVGNTLINVDATGKLQGIGTGAGAVVDNTKVVVGGTNSVKKADWSGANYFTSTAMPNGKSGWGFTINKGTSNVVVQSVCKPFPKGQEITLSFVAWIAVGTGTCSMNVDLFPDTLPETNVTLTTTPTKYSWTTNSSHADMSNASTRFFLVDATSNNDTICITDIQWEIGNKATDWSPNPFDVDSLRQAGFSGDLNSTRGAPAGTSINGIAVEAITSAINAATSDNIIAIGEKPAIYTEWQRILKEENSLYTRANEYVGAGKGGRYGVQAKRDELITVKDALSAYLSSVGIGDFTTNSAVDGANVRTLFANVYAKIEPFKMALQYLAAESADWGLTTGANRPADNATVGAPAGTYVGDMLAQDVVTTLGNITADGVLSKSEKSIYMQLYGNARGAYIEAGETSFGFVASFGTEQNLGLRQTADNAFANLNDYLNGLSPAWNDAANDTAIDGGLLRLRFQTLVEATQALVISNNKIASTKSTWAGLQGTGKPETYTIMARGNQTTTANLPAGYAHGLRGSDGQVFQDSYHASLRSDMYARSYTLCWRINPTYWAVRSYDVYGNSANYPNAEGYTGANSALNLATTLNQGIAPGTPIVIYTSDEPSSQRLTGGLPDAMYRCGASRAVFGSPNLTGWSSYVLIGTIGIGEGNGLELMSAGGATSYVMGSFSVVNGVVTSGGKTIKDATDIAFSDGRSVNALNAVEAGATVGAPSGTKVGTQWAEDVASAVTNITSDNILSKGEKTTLLPLVAALSGSYSEAASASYAFVSTFGSEQNLALRQAADNANTNLNTYLSGLSPAWNNLAVDTNIDGPTFRARFQSLVDTVKSLVISNTTIASSKSTWGGVAGTGKPADNATVGAPAGTNVGSTAAATIETRANDPATRINTNSVTVDGGKLTAGTITAREVAANSITTNKLLIGDTTNFAENADFGRGNVGWVLQNNSGVAPVIVASSEAYTASGWVGAVTGQGSGGFRNNAQMRVAPGDNLMAVIIAKGGAASMYPRISYLNAAGSEINVASGTSFVANGGYQRIVLNGVVPANAAFARVEAFYDVGANGFAYLSYGALMRRATGELIVDGAITTNKMTVNTINADRLLINTITGDKIVANAIAANQLTVQSRQVSTIGINMRINVDNSTMSWDDGQVRFVNSDGTMGYYPVTGSPSVPYQGAHMYFFYVPGRPVIDYNTDSANLGLNDRVMIAVWKGGTDLVVMAGVGTLVNGDRIVTGSIDANRVKANTILSNLVLVQGTTTTGNLGDAILRANDPAARINAVGTTIDGGKITTGTLDANRITANPFTGNQIIAGTIQTAQLAASAITASKLAVGNSDNIIPDGDFRDPSFWVGDNPPSTFYVGAQNSGWIFPRYFGMSGLTGYFDRYSKFFPVEPGATYKIKVGIYVGQMNNGGWMNAVIHMPGVQWFSLKTGLPLGDPSVADAPYGFTTNYDSRSQEFIFTNPTNAPNNSNRQWQFRFSGNFTGYAEIMVSITRVSDNTLIQDGAITTNKITVNSLNADRILSGTISGDKISTTTSLPGTITVGNTGVQIETVRDAAVNSGNATWYEGDGSVLNQYTFSGNKVTKSQPNAWTANAYTREIFFGGCIISGRLSSDETFMGLVTNRGFGNNVDWNRLDYAIHRSIDGNFYAYEGGVQTQVFGNSNAVGLPYISCSLVYDGKTVRWYVNGNLYREVATTQNRGFAGGVSIGYGGKYVDAISFTAGADNSLSRTDPAARINAFSTNITPGRIQIQGGTTLNDWKNGNDSTEIRGGAIAANTINANKLTIGNRGIAFIGLNFEWRPAENRVYWDNGYIYYTDTSGTRITQNINGGNTGNLNAHRWFMWRPGRDYIEAIQVDPGQDDQVILGAWWGGNNLNITYGGTVVNGGKISTNTITADKMNVASLSAISANIGSITAGVIRSANDATFMDIANNYFRFNATEFNIHVPGVSIVQPFQYANGVLNMRNVAIDGGSISNVTISTSKIIGNSVTTNAYITIDNGGTMGGFPQNSWVDFNTTSYGGGGSDGGGGGGSGGGGGACPVPETPILLANSERTGPGETKMAGDLKPGQDWVWTQHETTMEWGAYRVIYARVVRDVVVHEIDIDGNKLTASWDHPVWINDRWTNVCELADTCGRADVVQITIDDAHTYISNGILSHNKLVNQQQV
jgi:hypothetical protein